MAPQSALVMNATASSCERGSDWTRQRSRSSFCEPFCATYTAMGCLRRRRTRESAAKALCTRRASGSGASFWPQSARLHPCVSMRVPRCSYQAQQLRFHSHSLSAKNPSFVAPSSGFAARTAFLGFAVCVCNDLWRSFPSAIAAIGAPSLRTAVQRSSMMRLLAIAAVATAYGPATAGRGGAIRVVVGSGTSGASEPSRLVPRGGGGLVPTKPKPLLKSVTASARWRNSTRDRT